MKTPTQPQVYKIKDIPKPNSFNMEEWKKYAGGIGLVFYHSKKKE